MSCGNNNSTTEPNSNAEKRESEIQQGEQYGGGHGTDATTRQEAATAKEESGEIIRDPNGVNSEDPGKVTNTANQAQKNAKSDTTTRANANKKNDLSPNPPKP